MKESTRLYLLRLLALMGAAVFVYPAVLTIRLLLFKKDEGIVNCLLYLLLLSLGYMSGRALFREEAKLLERVTSLPAVKFILFTFNISDGRRFIAKLAAAAAFFIPLLAALVIFGPEGLFRVVFEVVFAFIPYYMALRNSYRSYDDIMSRNRLNSGIVIMLFAMETANFYSTSAYLKPYLFAAAYFCLFVCLILKNQEDIDYNIYSRRNIEKSILPKNMRSFNIKAIIVMFFSILLIFYLKQVALFLLGIAMKIAGLVTEGFIYLLYLLLPHIANKPGQTGQAPMPVEPAVGNEIHPLFNLISNILIYFALMYAVYRLILIIIRKLPELVRKLAALLKRLFMVDSESKAVEIEDYSDEVETLKPASKDAGGRTGSRIKRSIRNLKNITDPVERVRYIYGSILTMLPVLGAKPERADTTSEILVKASSISGIGSEFFELTKIYDEVRYGEVIPDKGSVAKADKGYSTVTELLGKK